MKTNLNIKAKGEYLYEIAIGLTSENDNLQKASVLENSLKGWIARYYTLRSFIITMNNEFYVTDKYKFIDELHRLSNIKLINSKFI